MKKAATAIAACILFALSSPTPVAAADPYEDTPDAAARDPDYAAGKAAMEKKDWAEAVRRFRQAGLRDPDSADLHNYLGFSYRNLKQMDLAFSHYKRSIALNPRHRGAHEYIGEAYLMLNDLPSAEKHLAALRSICLLPCGELADLEKAVTEHRKRAAKP
jgi:Flp pilus assembly protein TadD